VSKFGAFYSERPKAKSVLALGGLCPPCPLNQGLCHWTPLGASPPDPHYRGLTLVFGGPSTL